MTYWGGDIIVDDILGVKYRVTIQKSDIQGLATYSGTCHSRGLCTKELHSIEYNARPTDI